MTSSSNPILSARPFAKVPLDKILVGCAFLLGILTIAGALGSQYLGGLYPCDLCLEQRQAYYYGLPLLAGLLVLWPRLPRMAWLLIMALLTAIFGWSLFMASYHAGVEWGFWPGPTACAGVGESLSFDQLNAMAPVIGCDVVQFRFLGLSLAGYNALISLAITGLLVAAMIARLKPSARA